MNWSSLGFVTLMFIFTVILIAKHFGFDPNDESKSPPSSPLSESSAQRTVMIIAGIAMIAVALTT